MAGGVEQRFDVHAAAAPAGEAETALRELHASHGRALHGWARRRFADPREAEEVVQDTLVLAWRKRHQFDPTRGTERAWLFGILRNVANSRHRKNGRALEVVRPLYADDRIGFAHEDEDRQLDAAEVADAMATLTPEHRAVIVGAYYRGKRIRILAEELGLPEGTVKSRLYYALRSLRLVLEERGVLV